MPTPASALSCITCRARKIRCDKTQPCSACTRSGVECIFPSQRAQRRKQGRRNEELLRRLDHLEGLVERLGGEVAVTARAAKGKPLEEQAETSEYAEQWLGGLPPRAGQGAPKEEGTHPVMKEDGGRYLSEDFWTSLSGEVEGLRELLNEPSSEDEDDSTRVSVNSPASADPYERRLLNSLFIFSGDMESADLRWVHPPGPQIEMLSDVYFDRIDPTFKLLHKPTVNPWLLAAAADAANIPRSGGVEALMFAMYYAAVISLSDADCLKVLGKDRTNLAAQYRHCTEIALANADFLNSKELETLQAFVLYLVCLRCHNRTRSVWTLVSLAVRIAQDMNLHRDGGVTGFSPYETELRRRLWWQIVVLDIRACEDRGSFPLIDQSVCSTKMPLNIDDDDINPSTRTTPREKIGCTEITFSKLCQEASMVAPRFFSPVPADVNSDEKREQWQKNIQQEVETFKERLINKYVKHCDPTIPIQHTVSQVSQIVVAEFWLLVHYPIQTRRYAFKSNATKTEILEVAIMHLRLDYELVTHPVTTKYKWYYETYVQWHPLAVALAELCVQTRGPAVDKAWAIVDTVYERARSRVTDVSLWRPVKKLYRKARLARTQALRNASACMGGESAASTRARSATAPVTCPGTTAGSTIPRLPLENFDINTTAPMNMNPFAIPSEPTPHNAPAHATSSSSHPPLPQGQMPLATMPMSTSHEFNIMSAESMANMNLDSYGDPVNWQDWDEFVRSTWAVEDPNQQDKTNTPEWELGYWG
ncbi:uncharacterized protein K452DRAFT_320242 [Aplosporella prunicola CBS 121167]|uniref:Zn(2)-C6 fungal-type domain-containing protein n=1 Tax=Aplosporella prunicola CBS 121167 TaxID=1176127 RepID=A0A6A6B6F0_9PEZI|nr:uncharacterized protein K452DRAFT_320242 [Aplosporella prunicola CBS 121167]KAF2139590.1 hypothetical protein K452DRAFT_320242 [Aplosporella prunicola CBS 121167]